MKSLKREALMWLGGALLIALLVGLVTLALSPELSELSSRYSVL